MKNRLKALIARLHPRGLRARLFLLVFLSVVPALALILYTDRDQRRTAEKQARENLVRLSQVLNDENKLLIEGTRQLLTVLASLPAVREHNAGACDATMKQLAKDYRQYVGLAAVEANGRWFCGADLSAPHAVPIADHSWFQRTVQTREFTIGNYQVGRDGRRAVLPLAYPSVDEAGIIRAVVLAVVDLEWLKVVTAGSALPQDATVTLVDDQGLILAHYPDGEQWIGRSIAGTGLEKALRSGREGLQLIRGVDHIPRFVVFSSLGRGDESGAVHLILSTPQDAVFAEPQRLLRRNLLWLAPVSLAMFVAAWFGSEFFIVRQANSLLGAARRIAGGDLKARTGLVYTSGELGQLAASFDAMAAALEARAEETRRAEAKARENERLAAMGATAASIAHEIANPLTGMYSTVQFLEQQVLDPGGLRPGVLLGDVENLKREIERLHSLLQDLRYFVRSGQLDLKPVSLAELVSEIVALELHNHKARRIKAELNFPPGLPCVLADREKLKQVLLNLCKNAAEAMPDGGKLVVRAFQNQSEMVLEVQDTGSGIPEGVNVFDLFTTTKAHGMGIGLAIVRQIVAAHGGEISYTSESNRGTAFRISMPLAPPATEPAAQPTSADL